MRARAAAAGFRGGWALLAAGSYARGELSPGSDVDVLLVSDGRRGTEVDEPAAALWYSLWDAGFVLGHSVRTAKEAVRFAGGDIDAMTSLLDARLVAGEGTLAADVTARVRAAAHKRRRDLIAAFAAAAHARRSRPGPVAEMLEPDLKSGSGGLRDLQSLTWIGTALEATGPGGWDRLVERGYLDVDDRTALGRARDWLLDVRLALHRVTGGRTDLLTLQEQDAVAASLGVEDADDLVRRVAGHGRTAAWIAADVWDRLASTVAGPSRRGARPRRVADGVTLRDGRIALDSQHPLEGVLVLRAAVAAATHEVPFERAALARAATLSFVTWGSEERDAFVTLLATGMSAIPVLEALDHVGVLTRFLPEWERVRSLPQRNAYHRFTVDRHLLEAVARCAELRDDDGFDGEVARRCRADLLLLGALLHDVAKGGAEDHSVTGAETARTVAIRMGLDSEGTETLAWLVRHHLLMADTATRRDLADDTTVVRFGRTVGTAERLDLLHALTIGDSRATGPAAWNPTRAALVRELALRTDRLLEAGVVDTSEEERRRSELGEHVTAEVAAEFLDGFPVAYARTFPVADMLRHHELVTAGRAVVDWAEGDHGRLRVTVVGPDRPGLLARVAGGLAVAGIDIREAHGFTRTDGVAVEVFSGEDRFGRLADAHAREEGSRLILEAVTGEVDIESRLRERRRRYARPPGVVRTHVDLEASEQATVVEVEAPDEVGLLATVASVFADLGLDVVQAKVQTLEERVIDVFYVRSASGRKITDGLTLDRLRATLVARLTTEYSLPDRS